MSFQSVNKVENITNGIADAPQELKNRLIRHIDLSKGNIDVITLASGLHQLKFVALGLPSRFDSSEETIAIEGLSLDGMAENFNFLIKNGQKLGHFRLQYDQLIETANDAIRSQMGCTLRDILNQIEGMIFQATIEGMTQMIILSAEVSDAVSNIERVALQLLNNQEQCFKNGTIIRV